MDETLRNEIVFDFGNVIQEINRVEKLFDQAFTDVPVTLDADTAVRQAQSTFDRMEPLDVPVDIDPSSFQEIESTVDQIVTRMDAMSDEMALVNAEAGGAEEEIRQMAQAAGLAEEEAEALVRNFAASRLEALRVEDATREVAAALGLSERDARALQQEMRDTARAADSTATSLESVGRRGVSGFNNLRTSVFGVISALGALQGLRVVGRFIGDAVTLASDLEQSIGGVEAVFGDAADQIIRFGRVADQAFGLAADQFNSLATILGSQLQTFGFNAEAAADETQRLIGLGADLAATFGGPVNDAVSAISSLLRGEVNPIERYGVAMNQTLIGSRAMELGLVDATGAIGLQEKALAALSLLTEQTAKAQGQFAREASTTAGQLERVRAGFRNVQAEVGEAIIPLFLSLLETAPDLTDALLALTPAIASVAAQLASSVDGSNWLILLAADLPRGLATVTDVLGGVLGASTAAAKGLSSLFAFDTVAAADRFAETLDQIGQAADNIEIRVIEQDVIDGLRNGVSAQSAFYEALLRTNEGATLTLDTLKRFDTITGVTPEEAVPVLKFLIDNRQELELTTEGLRAVQFQYQKLQDEVRGGPIEMFTLARFTPAHQAAAEARLAAVEEEGNALVTLREKALEAEEPLLAFARANEEVVAAVLATADPLERLQVEFELARLEALELFDMLEEKGAAGGSSFPIFEQLPDAVGAISERLNKKTGELEEVIDSSATGILKRIREQNRLTAQFEADLVRLAAAGFGNLAQRLREEGPGAAAAAADFLKNLDVAAEAEEELTGTGLNAASAITSALAGDLEGMDWSSPAGIMVLNLAQDLENPVFLGFFTEVGNSYRDAIERGLLGGGPIAPPPMLPPPPNEIVNGRPGPGVPTSGGAGPSQFFLNLNNFRATDVTGAAERTAAIVGQISRLVS